MKTTNNTNNGMVNGFQEKSKLVQLYEAIHKVELEIVDGDYVVKWGDPEFDTVCSVNSHDFLSRDCYNCIFRYGLMNLNTLAIIKSDFPEWYQKYIDIRGEAVDDLEKGRAEKSEDGY